MFGICRVAEDIGPALGRLGFCAVAAAVDVRGANIVLLFGIIAGREEVDGVDRGGTAGLVL